MVLGEGYGGKVKRSEEIIFAVKTLSPKEGDIIVLSINKWDYTKKMQAQLANFFNEIKVKAITLSPSSKLEDIRICSDEELTNIGLMKIPNNDQ